MKQVMIADTGVAVSCFGLGTVKFGRNQGVKYPSSFELPSDNEILALLDYAQSLGINLLDTAPAYGTSEERLGKLLKSSRKDWVLSTKVGENFENGESSFDFTPQAVRSSIERSLKRLNTDYLDVVLVHSDGNDKKIIEEYEIFSVLNELKKSGKIRAIGMSTKTIEGGKLAVEQSDAVMVTYNPVDTQELPVIQRAHQKNKGVFIKKALASGHLQKFSGENPVATSIQFIFQQPGVSSVILGTLNTAHLSQNIQALNK